MSRLIEEPVMYKGDNGLIWDVIFQFPTNKQTEVPDGESLIWSKYAPNLQAVHAIGCARESLRKVLKPGIRYRGCLNAPAGIIRSVRNSRGHGFKIYHAPIEGIHHAEVNYLPATGSSLSKGDKSELKLMLRNVFSDLMEHSCVA